MRRDAIGVPTNLAVQQQLLDDRAAVVAEPRACVREEAREAEPQRDVGRVHEVARALAQQDAAHEVLLHEQQDRRAHVRDGQ